MASLTRLIMQLLRTRIGWFACALPLLGIGVLLVVTTHPLHFVRVDGTVSGFRDVSTATGSYDHSELTLAGSPQTYKLDRNEFTPSLPATLPSGTTVSVWVDEGHPWIYALAQPSTETPQYTTGIYDDPAGNERDSQIATGVSFGLGGLLLLVSLLWPVLPWRPGKRKRPQPNYVPLYMPTHLDKDHDWRP